jgi:hypothetical protein
VLANMALDGLEAELRKKFRSSNRPSSSNSQTWSIWFGTPMTSSLPGALKRDARE